MWGAAGVACSGVALVIVHIGGGWKGQDVVRVARKPFGREACAHCEEMRKIITRLCVGDRTVSVMAVEHASDVGHASVVIAACV